MNSIIAPWFNHRCPAPLTITCIGTSPGGVIFSSLWLALITAIGLAPSKMVVGGVMVAAAPVLSALVYRDTPESMGQHRNGVEPPATGGSGRLPPRRGPPSKAANLRRRPLSCYLVFFTQIGPLAHLFSQLVMVLGAGLTGIVMGCATLAASSGDL